MGSSRERTITSPNPSSRASSSCASATFCNAGRRPMSVSKDIRFGGCRFDVVRGELYRGGDVVHLTAAEAGLLSMLAQKAGQAVSREELSISLSGNVRNVDVQMTRLRRKIERDPRFPRYLQTVRGTGYILKPD